MQKRNDARRVDGFLLYDKPRGISSNAALQHVKRLYRAERAGHTGTLDPMASGLLIICFGQATRFAGELLGAPKTYLAELTLGVRTSSGDAEGSILSSQAVTFGADAIEPALAGFRGDILQIPPMHSALKRDGVPLYRMARQGKEVAREPRPVSIYELRVEQVSLPQLRIAVTCSKGTYIRVLAEDIGEALGCGAYLSALVRTGLGPFQLDDAQSTDSLAALSEIGRDRCLFPPDRLITSFPRVTLESILASRFCHGQTVSAVEAQGGEYRVYDEDGLFLGTGLADGLGALQPKRVFLPGKPP